MSEPTHVPSDPVGSFQLSGVRAELARTVDRHMLVLAGPGSGKTHLLSAHAVWIASQRRGGVLLLTFSHRAAREMESRVRRAIASLEQARLVTASTLHAWCLSVLRVHGQFLKLPSTLEMLEKEDVDLLASDVAVRAGLSADATRGYSGWLEEYRRERTEWKRHQLFESLQLEIDEEMRRQGTLDPGAVIRWTVDLLLNFDVVRASIRHHRPFVLVDEGQDCDAMQLELLELLVGRDQKSHLFLVMDPDQSLYGWRGANARAVLQWARSLGPREEMLTENYRCAPRIQALATMILGRAVALPLSLEGRTFLIEHPDVQAEAEALTKSVQTRWNSEERGTIAVLARADWRIKVLRSKLESAGIPVRRSLRIERSLDEEIAVEAICAVNAWKQQSEPDVVRAFLRDRLGVDVSAVQTVGDEHSLGELVNEPRWSALRSASTSRPTPSQLLSEVIKLLMLVLPVESDVPTIAEKHRTVRGFLTGVSGEARRTADTSREGVFVGTFHGAKGLEFDRVIVLGCEDGVVPDWRSDTDPARLEEERRALFVGVTRAAKTVLVTFVRSRDGRIQEPSRFLPLPEDTIWSLR